MRQLQYPTILDQLNQFYTVFEDSCCQETCKSAPTQGLTISEDEEKLYIDASLPGVKSEEIKVSLDPKSRHLFISGEGKNEREKVHYHVKSALKYNYEIPLSTEINLENEINAVSKDGILSIILAKNRGHKPLKIDVKSA